MIINSVDLNTMVDAILSEQLDRATDYLVDGAKMVAVCVDTEPAKAIP
jgi:hypothetical protein